MSRSLSPQLFAILSALVEERFGLHYGNEDLEIFSDKIAMRVSEAGFESALDYYYFLRYDPGATAELADLADALVVGETYFFRELDPLRAAISHVAAPAIAARGVARIWSAGCATGEEPLSIAMVLEEAGLRAQAQLVATDLSTRALAKAREGGGYGPRAMRLLGPEAAGNGIGERLSAIARKSLVLSGTRVDAHPELRAAIDYRQVNLLEEAAVAALGTFDLILCRNVLIYFADLNVKRIVSALAKALAPGGRLLIGASESLLRFGTVMRCEERGGVFLYAKEEG